MFQIHTFLAAASKIRRKSFIVCLKYIIVVLVVIATLSLKTNAQMRIDSYRVSFRNLPIHDVATNVQHSSVHRGEDVYYYQSTDSGFSQTFFDTLVRVDELLLPFVFNDGSQSLKSYQQDLSFRIDTLTNRIHDFYLYVGFSYDQDGWYSNQTITIDSFSLKRNNTGYEATISGDELAKAGITFHRTKGNISTSIAGWSATIDTTRSNFYSSTVSLLINGFLNLGVEKSHTLETMTISPNPASNLVTISVPTPEHQIHIYDMLAREVVSIVGSENTFSVNLSNLSNGIYWVKAGEFISKLHVLH